MHHLELGMPCSMLFVFLKMYSSLSHQSLPLPSTFSEGGFAILSYIIL